MQTHSQNQSHTGPCVAPQVYDYAHRRHVFLGQDAKSDMSKAGAMIATSLQSQTQLPLQ